MEPDANGIIEGQRARLLVKQDNVQPGAEGHIKFYDSKFPEQTHTDFTYPYRLILDKPWSNVATDALISFDEFEVIE